MAITELTTVAKEKSTYVITAVFTDEAGEALVPNSINWKLTDGNKTVINSRTSVSVTPASTINIVLTGDDLAINEEENKRIVTIWGTYTSDYGTNLTFKDEVIFTIDDLLNVT